MGHKLDISIHALRVEGDGDEGDDRRVSDISIHALRVEGDIRSGTPSFPGLVFLSTPSGWRATQHRQKQHIGTKFLSTPSGWRATWLVPCACPNRLISIHALRVEGDRKIRCLSFGMIYFYPRPPGGGRHDARVGLPLKNAFLSTPSGWRATPRKSRKAAEEKISIHALRVEGDPRCSFLRCRSVNFYPRPPGGGRQNRD